MGGDFWKLCWEGNLEGVRLALQKEDVDVNSVDEEGRSGLMWAFINGATSVHVTKHLYEERLRDLVYMKSIYMK